MAITIKEIQVRTSIVRKVNETPLPPEIVQQIKDEVLREIKNEIRTPYSPRKER